MLWSGRDHLRHGYHGDLHCAHGSRLERADLIDRIVWTQSHHLIGGDAIPAIGDMSMLALPDQTHYIVSDEGHLGDDRWLVLDRRSGENLHG